MGSSGRPDGHSFMLSLSPCLCHKNSMLETHLAKLPPVDIADFHRLGVMMRLGDSYIIRGGMNHLDASSRIKDLVGPTTQIDYDSSVHFKIERLGCDEKFIIETSNLAQRPSRVSAALYLPTMAETCRWSLRISQRQARALPRRTRSPINQAICTRNFL
jgi:hypothetical protein